MSYGIRPITIRSRYQEVECTGCGAMVIVDMDGDPDVAAFMCDPFQHEDDCPRARDIRPDLEG